MGSGKIIKSSVKKYGKESHLFEILEFLPDKQALKNRESEIVNEDLIANELYEYPAGWRWWFYF